MATKKKTAPKKPAKRINLHEEIRNAILEACANNKPPKSLAVIEEAGASAILKNGWLPPFIWRAIKQEVRDLIASGQIVKAGGVYRRAYIGGPGGEELPATGEIEPVPRSDGRRSTPLCDARFALDLRLTWRYIT